MISGDKMTHILNGFIEGFKLIISGDMEMYKVIFLSLFVSSFSVFIATLISLPVGIITGLKEFKGKKIFSRILFTLMGVPPVVVGLFVAIIIARRGPLGELQLMFTPTAMVVAQTLLVIPIVMGNIFNNVNVHGREILLSCRTLGAGKFYTLWILVKELKNYILIAVVTGFGRAISEVGAIMLVGGNIKGKTRAMTTFIAMNNSMGNYSQSIAMGIVLILLAFMINSILYRFILGDKHD